MHLRFIHWLIITLKILGAISEHFGKALHLVKYMTTDQVIYLDRNILVDDSNVEVL